MRQKGIKLLTVLTALALMLNVVLTVPLKVAADDGIVKDSIEYPGGKVVDGTGIWNSAGGGQYQLEGDFDVTFSFTNDPFDVASNWGNNFVFEFMPAADTAGVTLRADRYGWTFDNENVSNVPFYLGTVTWNWDNYVEMCQTNTFVTLNIKKMSDNVVSAVAEFKSVEGGTSAGTVTYAIVYPKGVPDSLVVQLGANNSKITIWKCIYNTCTATETTKDYADKTIAGYLSDSASEDTLSGDFRAVYSFKNKSNGTNNWDNFIFDISGSGLSIIARADAYDAAHTLDGCWASDFNWDTLVSDMTAGADVTAIIERIGNELALFYIIEGNSYTYFATARRSFDTLPDELTVKLSGEAVTLSDIKATIYKLTYTAGEEEEEYDPSKDTAISYGTTSNRVTVHDPSIVKDETTGYYYIFGSHMAWARSKDLINWQTFSNNINRNYSKLFAEPAKWSAHGSSSYDVSGNLWAPDVIWNDTMKKWCMYMSVNGDNFYSSIVLLTADNIEGPYTYVGPVVYSGFTTATAAETDFEKVTGSNTVDERYTRYRNSTNNRTYGMNAIDPCVTYDENGDLWMSYGSWFGGIYMLKLDKNTGLRDYTKTYTLNEGVSDPYQGIKLAGGDHSSGEASYLEKIGDYWYLFMTYGGLTANGGYNMRVFRSESIEGPYVDLSGDNANYASYYNNINGTVGNRLMTYYKWSYMENGQVAQGHNSAFVDNDGRAYVIYHTRFDDGTEGHQVRVHQLFVNEDGWLVTAPFEYSGENLTAINAADVAGKYEVLFHKGTDYAKLECAEVQTLVFKEDGTLSGAIEGTWKLSGYNVTLTTADGKTTYKGVFVNQKMEEQDQETLCFTVIGSDEISVWGYNYPYSNEDFIDMAAQMLNIPIGTFAQNITLPSEGLYDVSINWSSGNTAVIANDGKVTVPDKDTVVILTATMTYEGTSKKFEYPVKVFSSKSEETEKYLLWEYFTDEKQDLSGAKEGSIRYPNPFNADNVLGININNGISIEFEATPKGAMQYLSNIFALNAGAAGGLYFTGGSYLGYNATGGWFDANVKNTDPWAAGTDFIGSGAKIRIDLSTAGFKVYVNGELAYTQADIGGAVPGGTAIDSYASVLSYLRNTATYLNFGWGSWWDGGFNGTISNVKLYVQPAEYVDTSGYVYYEDYNSTTDTGWISPNAQGSLTIRNDGDEHGGYVYYAAENVSGNRGAYTDFPEEANLSGRYVVEADIMMTPGNVADRSVSQFAITGMDAAYDGNNYNNGIISGYILKLSTDVSEAGSTTYYINDGEQSVVIPANTWVHIKASVTDGTKVLAEITVNGVTKSFATEVNGNGVLKGLYLLRGRGTGTAAVDNVTVTEHNYGEPVRENEIPATCTEDGSYDEVIYCTECGEEVSRVTRTIPALGHVDEDGDGYCDRCEVCMHWHDEDGYCTEDDCDHGEECCPKPEESDGSIKQDVQIGEGAPDVRISMDIEDLKAAVLTEEEKEALENGADVEIIMSVKVQENVDPDDKAAIEEAAEGKYAVGMYLELNLDIYINNELSRSVALLDEPIRITVDIPEELRAEGREYVILRVHDGEVDILKDLDSDPNTITFETDRFSTYAIGYSVSETSNPADPADPADPGSDVPFTGEEPLSAARIAVIILSAAVLCGTVYIKRRPTVKR